MTDRTIRIKIDASSASREIGRFDSQMRQLGSTADGIQTQLTRVAQAIATAFSVRQIVAYADEFTNVQNKLRVVTNGTQELAAATSNLLQIANETRSSFDATADLYSKLARSTEELGVSNERLLAITTTINKSFAVAGASAIEASNAIRQLGQGLAAGALRGDEFNSVAEQAPGILRAVSAETGKTIGELREFAAEGGITAELLIRSIENYADTVDREFAKTNRTFEQSAVIARNNAIAFVGSSESFNSAARAAGDSLVLLSENLEVLSDAFLLISSVVAGKYLSSVAAAVQADIAKRSSTIALIRSEQALAVEQNRRSIQEQQAAQRALANAANDKLRSVAITNLARANQAAIATQARLNAATAAYAGVATASGIAARGLSAAFALLGGPLGAVLIAASAFLIFRDNAQSAQVTSKALSTEIDELSKSYSRLSRQAFGATALQLQKEAISIDQQLADKKQQLAKATEQAIGELDILGGQVRNTFTDTKKLRAEIEQLEAAKSALAPKIAAVNKFFEDGLPKVEDYTDATAQTNVQLQDLANNFDLIRKVGAEIDRLFTGEFNLFGGSNENQSDDSAARINARIEALRLETQTISSELALQQAVRQGFLTQEQADLDLQTATKIQRAITERELLLAEKNITDEQILAAEAAFSENMAVIAAQRAEKQIQLGEYERRTRLMQLGQLGDSLMSLGQGQSKKVFEIGKKLALAQAAIALPTAVMESFKNGGGYPWGLVPAAAMAATGLKNIQNIRSQTFGGGGSASASLGAGAGAGASPISGGLPTTPQAAQNVQTLEIVGLREEIDRLESADGFVSTQFVAKILEKIDSANRLRGGE